MFPSFSLDCIKNLNLNKSKKKIPKTFIGFLITSFLIWLLITLSKEYTAVLKYNLVYENIPQNKLLQEEPIKEIDIAVNATGFKLISSKFNEQTIKIEASNLQNKGASNFYILPKNQSLNIQNQLPTGVLIQEIIKDTIFFNLGFLASKKIALKPNLNINYHIGYDLVNAIKIQPDSVIISGPNKIIESLEFLSLSKLDLNDVKKDFNENVKILMPKNSKTVKLSKTNVTISGKVEQYTEGKVNIPFTITNLNENINLTSLTKTIEISYVVALSNFANVTEDSFKIECDFKLSNNNGLSYLIPKIVKKPDFIKSYKIIPTKVDFLIQK